MAQVAEISCQMSPLATATKEFTHGAPDVAVAALCTGEWRLLLLSESAVRMCLPRDLSMSALGLQLLLFVRRPSLCGR